MAITITTAVVGGNEDQWGSITNLALTTILDAVNGTTGTIAPNLSTLTINGTNVTSTAAELNKLDGFSGTFTDLNYAKDLKATGVTTAEFDKLDGLTASTAELNFVDGVTSSIQTQLNSKQSTITGGATTIDTENLTANRALISSGSGKVAVSAVTATELGYLDGVTSSIQTQLNSAGTMNNFKLKAGITELTINENKELFFIGGTGINVSWTDTSTGSSSDPYDMTFSLTGDQRLAAATDVYVGNAHEHIHFNDASQHIEFMTGNAEEMRLENDGDLHVDGDVVAFSTTVSDQRLKHNIQKIDNALDKVLKLNGYTFTYNKNNRKSAGVIAQEVQNVLPSAVTDDTLVFDGEDGVTYKTVQYDQLHGLLIEAIKELKEEIKELKNDAAR
tara:strand:+ start:4571 stop:5740 length:1170 start_codon:yes stop_codon:yes gene_type:complete